jgi:glyoxylase-like metal-dependent hydrolase (beta-lactamase superfamily II)
MGRRKMDHLTQSKHVFKIELPTPFPVGDINVYVIKGDQLTLIDAGPKTEEAWNSFQHQLKQIGYSPKDIEQIVLTHHHPDHVGMLDYFNEEIPVIGHPFNNPWLKKDQQFFRSQSMFFKELFNEFGVDRHFLPILESLNQQTMEYSCDRELKGFLREGEVIGGLPGWRTLETPGHAQSHLAFYEESTGRLIGGDLLLKHISPNPLLEPPMTSEQIRPKPQLQLNQSISRLLEIPISLAYTGHGENIEAVHELISYRLKKQAERAELVRTFLIEKPLTAFQVCQTLFPKIYDKQLLLTMSETVGQLDYLSEAGQISVDVTQKTHRFFAI